MVHYFMIHRSLGLPLASHLIEVGYLDPNCCYYSSVRMKNYRRKRTVLWWMIKIEKLSYGEHEGIPPRIGGWDRHPSSLASSRNKKKRRRLFHSIYYWHKKRREKTVMRFLWLRPIFVTKTNEWVIVSRMIVKTTVLIYIYLVVLLFRQEGALPLRVVALDVVDLDVILLAGMRIGTAGRRAVTRTSCR